MNEERQAMVKPLLGIPDRFWCFSVIPIGIPAEEKEPRTQYDEAKVYWERWEER
jgi:hypothetical protein